jgi:hypothetical protein
VAEDRGGEGGEDEDSFQTKMIGQMRSGTSFRNVNVELRKKMAVQMQLHLGHVHFDECVLSGIRVRFDVFWTGRHRYPQKT